MTQKEKAKAYDKALERAKEWFNPEEPDSYTCIVESIFPELKESEDEKIRKGIISGMKALQEKGKCTRFANIPMDNVFAWLEKQGNPADEIEPKFKVGNWVTDGVSKCQIRFIDDTQYWYSKNCILGNIESIDKRYHLWTIQDVKDGDILATEPIDSYPFPFVAIYENRGLDLFNSYCFIGFDGKFYQDGTGHSIENIHPATKEQRDLLFKKMKEVGYEWDEENKELNKIEKDLTEFENALADVCRGWIGEELGWKDYIIKNSFPLLKLAKKQFDKYESSMIQWKGNNLNEVIAFTGKDKNFDKWFTSFEEYEKYVHEHNDIFKLFNEDGSHYEVPVGAWIVKTPDGRNVASKAVFKNKSTKWSEEDKKILSQIISIIEDVNNDLIRAENISIYTNWLKNKIQPQLKWKPSEEQLKSLQEVIDVGHFTSYPNALETLYEQLKQL